MQFTAILFIRAINWNPPTCPPTGERWKARWSFRTAEHYSIKWDELLIHSTRMILRSIRYMKEARPNRLCIVWVQLYDILDKAKLEGWRTDQWSPRVRDGLGGSHCKGTRDIRWQRKVILWKERGKFFHHLNLQTLSFIHKLSRDPKLRIPEPRPTYSGMGWRRESCGPSGWHSLYLLKGSPASGHSSQPIWPCLAENLRAHLSQGTFWKGHARLASSWRRWPRDLCVPSTWPRALINPHIC